MGGKTYEASGVSLSIANAVLERLRAAVESTGAQGFGAFAGLYPLDESRLLAASTDSIGTKPMVARARGRLRNCGRDLVSGLPKTIILSSEEVRHALEEPVAQIVDAIKQTLDKTPPELSADIMDRGIVLAGGGALLHGLD